MSGSVLLKHDHATLINEYKSIHEVFILRPHSGFVTGVVCRTTVTANRWIRPSKSSMHDTVTIKIGLQT